ncbi:hypothetical protein ACNGJQ_08375 [Campylobacter coli]|uniref:hypothetical protein n=1 Tax=Campylobacter TaxID=194 RepID=UPI0001EF8A34|nr:MULTISPECIES: hypothetical protein [Campylobacter]ADT66962.1 hypothetical protein ICDCCJ07001_pTet000037 [Campylobacter jejuni subsp. jejuni ICDCCJ07001]ELF8542864.1 hypothetical protein [Campylobacter jejuni]ENI11212.1 hypothetical protein H840_1724 [Campylobacter jejuni subsp. jejuni ICDCCJ07002]MCE7233889.1 hypothetical protein [Campylobacter coli]MCH3713588.1 hypothetical protein [Campylobacter coli]
MLLENIQENNQYSFYSLQNDIDDIAKKYMDKFFAILTLARNENTKFVNLKHFHNLKNAEMEIFFDNVFRNNEFKKNIKDKLELFDKGRKHLKKGSYPVLICFLNELYKNLIINDKQFENLLVSTKKEYFIRIIDKKRKGIINIYFQKDKENVWVDRFKIVTDGFGGNDYDEKMLYYGLEKANYIKINEKFIEEELEKLNLLKFI